MTESAPCKFCHGHGTRDGVSDCLRCIGTGWQDKTNRFGCQSCGRSTREPDMRVSPDEDGNRMVCETCLADLEAEEVKG